MLILKIKKKLWYKQNVVIVDEIKNVHNCTVSTCERHRHLPYKFACFWCHIIYEKIPIHCPIRHHPKQVMKVFKGKTTSSGIAASTYTIKGNVDDSQCDFQICGESYYEVDGSFCSFSCCLAFIRNNNYNPLYSHSEMLLFNMVECKNIVEAPHWRLRDVYGGQYNEDEFKSLIGQETFQYQHNIVFMNHLFEKNLFYT